MRNSSGWMAWGLIACALAAACGEDSPEGPEAEQITGTWNATRVEYVSKSSPATVELIALGAAATLVIDPGGTFEYSLTPHGGGPLVTTGTWVLDGDLWRATPSGMGWSWEWNVSLSAGELALTGAGAEYDCDGDGTPEEATWNLAFRR